MLVSVIPSRGDSTEYGPGLIPYPGPGAYTYNLTLPETNPAYFAYVGDPNHGGIGDSARALDCQPATVTETATTTETVEPSVTAEPSVTTTEMVTSTPSSTDFHGSVKVVGDCTGHIDLTITNAELLRYVNSIHVHVLVDLYNGGTKKFDMDIAIQPGTLNYSTELDLTGLDYAYYNVSLTGHGPNGTYFGLGAANDNFFACAPSTKTPVSTQTPIVTQTSVVTQTPIVTATATQTVTPVPSVTTTPTAAVTVTPSSVNVTIIKNVCDGFQPGQEPCIGPNNGLDGRAINFALSVTGDGQTTSYPASLTVHGNTGETVINISTGDSYRICESIPAGVVHVGYRTNVPMASYGEGCVAFNGSDVGSRSLVVQFFNQLSQSTITPVETTTPVETKTPVVTTTPVQTTTPVVTVVPSETPVVVPTEKSTPAPPVVLPLDPGGNQPPAATSTSSGSVTATSLPVTGSGSRHMSNSIAWIEILSLLTVIALGSGIILRKETRLRKRDTPRAR